jgi:hypothetical protein
MMRGLLVVMLVATAVRADDDPWAAGVPIERQREANAVFAEANQLFAQQAHAPALAKYKAAIALWDHPLIRFNMAVTEIRLDRILDAAEDLDRALRYGSAPFTPDLYREALDYQALVKRQVGTIEASCTTPGAHLLLDGKPWFVCPGTQSLRVLAGAHALVGERADYMTESRRLIIIGGSATTERIQLVPIETAVVLRYPYPRWLPWAATGGGAAVAIGGLGLWLWGRTQMDQFNADFAKACPTGCVLADHPDLARERDAARLKGNIGVPTMIAGGAVAIGGIVMMIVVKPKRIVPNVEVGPTSQGAAIRGRF